MAKKTVRKKKAVKRPARKKKRATPIIKLSTALESTRENQKAHWKAYHDLRAQIENAWSQLKNDVKNGTHAEVFADHQRLLVLMGECNYMLQECIRLRNKRRGR